MPTIAKRPTPAGQTHYQARIRLKGYPPQVATFVKRRDAERWAKETEAALREGRYFKVPLAARRSVAEMIDRYLRDVLPEKPGSEKQRAQFLWWREKIGYLFLSDLTPAFLAEWRDRLARGETPRRTLPLSRHVLSDRCSRTSMTSSWLHPLKGRSLQENRGGSVLIEHRRQPAGAEFSQAK